MYRLLTCYRVVINSRIFPNPIKGFIEYATMRIVRKAYDGLLPGLAPYLFRFPGFTFQMLLDWRDGSDIRYIASRAYEPHETAFFLRTLQPADTVIDVGACIGYFTLLASRLASKVVAIEPVPRNVHSTEQSIALNGMTNVVVVPKAVGDTEGIVSIRWRITRAPNGTAVIPAIRSRHRPY
jgi:hypothetical protein